MTDRPLENKRIAVLVENQYIQSELDTYRERFGQYGASVDFMSRLWQQPSVTFVSEVENEGKTPSTITVNIDFEDVNLEDYAAIIMSANYTSVRLRYFEAPEKQPVRPEMIRQAPAVRFFGRAMRNPHIIKGALCHGLWILTPMPEYLAGRKVICHEVILADVVNAGGVYTPSANDVVVDGDLVTGRSANQVELFVDAIKDQILSTQSPASVNTQNFSSSQRVNVAKPRSILMLLSEWGYWGEELIGPLEEFDKAGYEVDFCTPTGKRPNAIPVSMDPDYYDPPLRCSVTSGEVAAKTRIIDDPATEQGKRLDNPINLSEWFPERPYWSVPQFVRAIENYNEARVRAELQVENYDALLIVGGSGPIVDLANNHRVHDLVLGFYKAGKPIAAECYGVACLAFARNIEDRESIIRGKHITGHCLEYDYKDGTGFVRARGEFLDFNMGPPPYPLEFIIRDATGPDGAYIGNFGKPRSVIVDYPFITGRSTPDSYLTGQKLIEVLDGDPPLRRWGW